MILIVLLILLLETRVLAKHPPPTNIWPAAFNATLFKIGTDADPSVSHVWWTKFYFQDLPGASYSRFDFYNHYLNFQEQWEPVCSIIFHAKDFYVMDTDTGSGQASGEWGRCQRRPGVGNLSRFWLQESKYQGSMEFRGQWAHRWDLDAGPGNKVVYYASDQTGLPLRSTNQGKDPGATDYFDVVVGQQKSELFQLPKSCEQPVEEVICPPDSMFLPDHIGRIISQL